MTVFGVFGFILLSGSIYLSLLGGAIGVAIGRLIGSRFRSRMRYRTIEQRIVFEMELLLKWAKQQRKKNNFNDQSLMLLLETITMEVA